MPRKRNRELFDGGKEGPDMSPMIDLVFLLLIFFMVASTLITYKKDENVNIPVALDAQVPELIEGRVIVNIYEDGTFYDVDSRSISLAEIEQTMREAKSKNPNSRLHLRADKNVPHQRVREVIAASAKGGVNSVIFSSYVTGN